MTPEIKDGAEVLVSSIPYLFSSPKKNDIVAFKKDNEVFIKRIKNIKGNLFLMYGDNANDSLKVGWIERKDLLGAVIYIL